MSSARYDLSISAARAGALFASPLQRSDEPSASHIRRAIATDPEYAWSYVNLGRVLADQKQPVEAVAAFQKAFDLRPDSPQQWSDFGMALRDQKMLAEAEAFARQAVARWPDDARGWQSLGAALGDQAAAGNESKLPETVAVLRKAAPPKPWALDCWRPPAIAAAPSGISSQ